MFGVEAAKLFTPRAAKLATQEAAKLVAVVVESDARLFGQALRGLLIRRELGEDGADVRRRPN